MLRKRETSLFRVNPDTGNDELACAEYRVDNIRNFLIKDEKLLLMAIRSGGRSLLSIDPITCQIDWEIPQSDESNYGHLNYYSFAVDLGGKILCVNTNNFILRSPSTGEVEWKYPEGFNTNNLDLTHFLHLDNKRL